MTTAKPKTRPDAKVWEPYPELPWEPKEMMQMSPVSYFREMFLSILTPGFYYFEHPSILAAGEVPIYYAERAPGASGPPPHVIPDCMVAFDVDTRAIHARVGYDPIQNGKPPDLVVEVASESTRRRDSGHKRDVYQAQQVPEYWRFDSTGGVFYGQSIIGERLVNGRYERIPLIQYDDGSEGATSPVVNLNFRWRDEWFHIHDPVTGIEYEHPHFAVARQQEAMAAQRDEIERLVAENRRLRGEG